MALDNTKKTTSMQPKNVSKDVLKAIRKVANDVDVYPRNNADLVTWWLNNASPAILNDNRCMGVLLLKIPK